MKKWSVFIAFFATAALSPSLTHAQAHRVGPGIQIKPQANRPATDSDKGTVWCKSGEANAPFYSFPNGTAGRFPVVSPSPSPGQVLAYGASGIWTPTNSIAVTTDSLTVTSDINSVNGDITAQNGAITGSEADLVNGSHLVAVNPPVSLTATRAWSYPDWDGTHTGKSAGGQDVASSGAGAQSTTIASLATPPTGFYRVTIVVSCTTADTVTATITYTDAVNTTAQTLTPISSVSCGTNGTTSATVSARANASTTLAATLTLSSHNTTKASAIIERLN